MSTERLAQDRSARYAGPHGAYNTVPELISLRRSRYLLGGESENTPRDWTEDESAAIKQAYRHGEHTADIATWFPAEADEVGREHQ